MAMSTTSTKPQPAPASASPTIPPLESGDRLTRPEFERRYDAMPDLKKAELIEGVVYVPSPVRAHRHGRPHADVMGWLSFYRAHTPHVWHFDNASDRFDLDNMPQPDALLMIDPARGGQAWIDEDDYVAGAPELIVEIAASSASYDLHDKLDVYRRHGVQEYVVWRVLDQAIDWFVLREGRYQSLAVDDQGRFRSQVFPGLWLDPQALIGGELAKVLDNLRQGLGSPEHSAFVKQLKAEKKDR